MSACSIVSRPYRSHWILFCANLINLLVICICAHALLCRSLLTVELIVFLALLVFLCFLLMTYHYILTNVKVSFSETTIVFENLVLHRGFAMNPNDISQVFLYIPFRGPGVYVITANKLTTHKAKEHARKRWQYGVFPNRMAHERIMVFDRVGKQAEVLDSMLKHMKPIEKVGYPWE